MEYYEILGVPTNCEPRDIQRALDAIENTFMDNEMAVYSLTASEKERNDFLEEVRTAANTLLDREKREAYDEDNQVVDRYIYPSLDLKIEPTSSGASVSAPSELKQTEMNPAVKSIDDILQSAESIDGTAIKQLREARGLTQKDVADALKISVTQTNAIEEMDKTRLPAEVYVRGFVRGYARYLRVSPDRVVSEYMDSFKKA